MPKGLHTWLWWKKCKLKYLHTKPNILYGAILYFQTFSQTLECNGAVYFVLGHCQNSFHPSELYTLYILLKRMKAVIAIHQGFFFQVEPALVSYYIARFHLGQKVKCYIDESLLGDLNSGIEWCLQWIWKMNSIWFSIPNASSTNCDFF